MEISERRLMRGVRDTGFDAKPLEKAVRLLDFLSDFQDHPDLRNKFALKGGTALNLFFLDLPRLSVDIDLNYIESSNKEVMQSSRDNLEVKIAELGKSKGYKLERKDKAYALTSFLFSFTRASGGRDSLKVELNYLTRQPLFDVNNRSPRDIGSFSFSPFTVLDIHELLAGKLRALLERDTGRDLYDISMFVKGRNFQETKLRNAFILYGACSRKDWREVDIEDIVYDVEDITNNLVPMLRSEEKESIDDIEKWINTLAAETRRFVGSLVDFTQKETKFLQKVNERGVIDPELLTTDKSLHPRIKNNPALRWKTKNVREHFIEDN